MGQPSSKSTPPASMHVNTALCSITFDPDDDVVDETLQPEMPMVMAGKPYRVWEWQCLSVRMSSL